MEELNNSGGTIYSGTSLTQTLVTQKPFYFHHQTQHLANTGGRTVEEATKRIMKAVMHSDVAVKCNMTGRNQKVALKESVLFDCVFSKYIKSNIFVFTGLS